MICRTRHEALLTLWNILPVTLKQTYEVCTWLFVTDYRFNQRINIQQHFYHFVMLNFPLCVALQQNTFSEIIDESMLHLQQDERNISYELMSTEYTPKYVHAAKATVGTTLRPFSRFIMLRNFPNFNTIHIFMKIIWGDRNYRIFFSIS